VDASFAQQRPTIVCTGRRVVVTDIKATRHTAVEESRGVDDVTTDAN